MKKFILFFIVLFSTAVMAQQAEDGCCEESPPTQVSLPQDDEEGHHVKHVNHKLSESLEMRPQYVEYDPDM